MISSPESRDDVKKSLDSARRPSKKMQRVKRLKKPFYVVTHGGLTRECSGRLEPKRKDAKFQTDQQGARGLELANKAVGHFQRVKFSKGPRGKEGRRKHKGETQGQFVLSTTTTGGRGKEGACVSSLCPSCLTQTLTYTRHACAVSLLLS